ncbi:hypothetical protein NCC49_000368 [Naganishia albida]|nr:hypothetical protein NCC49_000368 [Naganishia albida]
MHRPYVVKGAEKHDHYVTAIAGGKSPAASQALQNQGVSLKFVKLIKEELEKDDAGKEGMCAGSCDDRGPPTVTMSYLFDPETQSYDEQDTTFFSPKSYYSNRWSRKETVDKFQAYWTPELAFEMVKEGTTMTELFGTPDHHSIPAEFSSVSHEA